MTQRPSLQVTLEGLRSGQSKGFAQSKSQAISVNVLTRERTYYCKKGLPRIDCESKQEILGGHLYEHSLDKLWTISSYPLQQRV